MRSGQTAREIDDEAAGWALRCDDPDFDQDVDQGLQAWLAGDARRGGALLRAQAALSLVDRARALPEPQGQPAPEVQRIGRRGVLVAGAACLAVATVAGVAALSDRPQRFSTTRGELRRVPLGDGSLAEINTETQIDVTMAPRLRRVRLERGEALFTVVQDPVRPFVVEAADLRVAAIGAAFSVYDAIAHIDVLVTEGAIEAWRRADKATRVRVGQGSRLRVGRDGTFAISDAAEAIARDLAWRTGQIDLAGRTLGEAVAEFNRYNRQSIVIDDPALAGETLVGLFSTNEPESFARSVSLAFGAHLSQTADAIHLGR